MSAKTQKKKQQKVIQDRTFGLKNKNKSKAVQKFVKGVQSTVKFNGVAMTKIQSEEFQKRKLKKKEEQEKALFSSLYNDVNKLKQGEESEEEDPANIVCPYFKQGICQKGKKCIYSHDLTLDRTEDIDLYVDQRTQLIMNAIGGKQLSSLTEEQLNAAIGEREREIIKGCRSDIVCKFFLEAAEKDKYGWNWSCPNNGDKCKYKHCLPPGYRLKKDAINGKYEQQIVNLEQKIDEERNRLLAENRPTALVTLDIFLKWKEDRRIKKEADAQKKKVDEEKKNKTKGQLRTGRQLFSIDPNLFVDDEQAAADYQQEQILEEEVEEQKGEKLYEDEEDEQNLEKEQQTEIVEQTNEQTNV